MWCVKLSCKLGAGAGSGLLWRPPIFSKRLYLVLFKHMELGNGWWRWRIEMMYLLHGRNFVEYEMTFKNNLHEGEDHCQGNQVWWKQRAWAQVYKHETSHGQKSLLCFKHFPFSSQSGRQIKQVLLNHCSLAIFVQFHVQACQHLDGRIKNWPLEHGNFPIQQFNNSSIIIPTCRQTIKIPQNQWYYVEAIPVLESHTSASSNLNDVRLLLFDGRLPELACFSSSIALSTQHLSTSISDLKGLMDIDAVCASGPLL